MSGPDDVTVVWVEKAEAREDALRAVGDWGRARGLKVTIADDTVSPSAVRVDLTIADRVEKELDRAREAVAALDADVAERALARADALLREHPELPQAAWQRAEVQRAWAARFTRVEPRDDARAAAAWQEADALDGGRAVGIGEVAFPSRPKVAATLAVRGASRAVVARLDGVELTGTSADGVVSYPMDVAPAEHQLVLSVDGEIVHASWVAIANLPQNAARQKLEVPVGEGGACSASSFAGVTRDGATVRAPRVSCGEWVAAAPAPQTGAVLVARCRGSACGPFLEWRSESSFGEGMTESPGKSEAKPHATWPAWATWTAVGVGAVAATTITLIATGIFESRPPEQRFTNGGVRVE